MGKRKRKSFEVVPSDFPDEVLLDSTTRNDEPSHADDGDSMHDQPRDEPEDIAARDDSPRPSSPPPPPPPSSSRPRQRYLQLHDFTSAVTSADNAVVETALARFAAQVKDEHAEHKANPSPLPTDSPSPLLSTYISASPECLELFAVFDRATTSYTLTGRAVDAIQLLLSPRYHPESPSPLPALLLLARRFLKTRLRALYKLLHLADTRLPLSALRLLHALASLSPAITRELIHSFNLAHRAFLLLPQRAFTQPPPRSSAASTAPDKRQTQLLRLRAAYIDLLLLLLRSSDAEVVAHALTVPRYVASVTKHLGRDDEAQVTRVLSAVIGVMRMKGVADDAKFGVLGEGVLEMLIRVWGGGGEAYGEAGQDELGRLAAVMEAFFGELVACVREEHAWSIAHRDFGRWKYHKALLSRLLTALHPSTSAGQRALLVDVLRSFPSLVPGYLVHLPMSFEPRLSSRWLANMAFLSDVLALPLDPTHLRFLLSECASAASVAHHVTANVFPATLTRPLLTQAVQHAELQVRLIGCRAVVDLLTRFAAMMAIVDDAMQGRDGWTEWRAEVVDAARQRLPNVQLVFQMRVKIWPASATPSADDRKDGGRVDDTKAELYDCVLRALHAYERLGLGGEGIDMWKLLLVPSPSLHSTLTLIRLLHRCTNSPRMFHTPQQPRPVDDEKSPSAERPSSYFGHLLHVLVDARAAQGNEDGRAVGVELMELIVKVMERTGLFGGGNGVEVEAVAELVGWFEALGKETVGYVERLMGYVSSKVYAASAAAVGDAPFTPLLRAALSPSWSTSSSSSSSTAVIGLLCVVLARLLSLSNPQRASVAAAIVHLPAAVAAEETKRVDEEEAAMEADSVSKPSRRNAILDELLHDRRFFALSTHAASLVSLPSKSPKKPSKSRGAPGVPDPASQRLSKLSAAQWDHEVSELVAEAVESSSARQSLWLYLALNHHVPLLSLPRVRWSLKGEEEGADGRIAEFVRALPPFTLFVHASKKALDLHYALADDVLASLCRHWTEEPGSEPQRLLLIRELTCHVLALLQGISTATSSSTSSAVVTLLKTLQSLILSTSTAHTTHRLSVFLHCQHQSRTVLDDFLSESEVSADVNRALASLVSAVLERREPQQTVSVQAFVERVVDACIAVATSPPATSALPLPLELLQRFSPHMEQKQLDRLSAAFVSSAGRSSAASGAWVTLLSEHLSVAHLLLAPRPAEALHLITHLSEGDALIASKRDALDELVLQLLQPPQSSPTATPTPSSSILVSARAYLVPEAFFAAALATPTPRRLRIVDAMLQSPAASVYVHKFAEHLLTLTVHSPRPVLLSMLSSCRWYVAATWYLPSALLPAQHGLVLSLLSAVLESTILPAVRAGEEDVRGCMNEVHSLVSALSDTGMLKVGARKAMLRVLLAPNVAEDAHHRTDEDDVKAGPKHSNKADLLTHDVFAVAVSLLTLPASSTADATRASAAELSTAASLLLLRAMATLTKLYKSSSSAEPFEEELTHAVLQLLGAAVYLPTVFLPSSSPSSAPSPAPLSLFADHLSYATLLKTSSQAELSRIVTRFLTSSLRWRFSSPSTHRLVFLLLTLQLPANERLEVRHSLSISPSTLLRFTPPSSPDLSAVHPVDGLLSAHTLFDLLVSHSQFLPIFLPPANSTGPAAESESGRLPPLQLALLQLLYLLFVFPVVPAPSPPPASLVALLSSAYGGAHTAVDLTLFALFSQLAPSASALLTSRIRWGEAGKQEMRRIIAGDASTTAPRLDEEAHWIYASFDAQRLQQGPIVATAALGLTPSSASSAPTSASKDPPTVDADSARPLSSRYSAAFVLPFFLRLFKHSSPDLKKLIDLGALAYALLSLSHPHLATRKSAYRLINRFFTALSALQAAEDAAAAQLKAAHAEEEKQRSSTDDGKPGKARYYDANRQRALVAHVAFKEAPEVLHLLSTLKNAVVQEAMYVPGVVTAWLGRAMWVVMHPQHRLYRAVNRFLLLRPALAVDDVPMFYQMFSSSAVLDWRMHRSWILRLMTDGCTRTADWHVLRRRHVLPILMAFHDSRHADRYTRLMVIDLIRRLACTGGEDDAVEGSDAEDAGSTGALASMVRRHAVFVWLRAMMDTESLSLHTLQPAMDLAAVLAKEIHARLPDHAAVLETGDDTTHRMEVDNANTDGDVEAEDADIADVSEDESASDQDWQAAAAEDGVKPALNGHAVEQSSDDDEDEEDDEFSPADRIRSARALSQRRLAMAQDLHLLFSTVMQRTAAFTHQHILTGQPLPITLPGGGEEDHVKVELEGVEEKVAPAEVRGHEEDARMLSFGSTSSSMASHVARLSQAVALLHQLLVTSQKARTASGVDAVSGLPPSYGRSLYAYLDVVVAPSSLAALCEAAPLLSVSAQEAVFQTITRSRPTGVWDDDRDVERDAARLLSAMQWTWTFASGQSEQRQRAIHQWLLWAHRTLDVRPSLASSMVDCAPIQDMLRASYATIRPARPSSSSPAQTTARGFRCLRLLNGLWLRLDSALPANRQMRSRLTQKSASATHLQARLSSSTTSAGLDEETVEGKLEERELVEEEELALLLQDHCWRRASGDSGIAGHSDSFSRVRKASLGKADRKSTGRKQHG